MPRYIIIIPKICRARAAYWRRRIRIAFRISESLFIKNLRFKVRKGKTERMIALNDLLKTKWRQRIDSSSQDSGSEERTRDSQMHRSVLLKSSGNSRPMICPQSRKSPEARRRAGMLLLSKASLTTSCRRQAKRGRARGPCFSTSRRN